MTRNVVLAPILALFLGLGACATTITRLENRPWFPAQEEIAENLGEILQIRRHLADKLGEYTMADVKAYIYGLVGEPIFPEHEMDNWLTQNPFVEEPTSYSDTLTWHFAREVGGATSVPMESWRERRLLGASLKVVFHEDTMVNVIINLKELIISEEVWSNKDLILAGAGLGSSLILIAGP